MKGFARWLIRWSLVVFVASIAWGFVETLVLGPKGPKVPAKSSIATQVFGD